MRIIMTFLAGSLIYGALFVAPARALTIEPDAVFVRVIDVGPGLASVVYMPGDFYMVYDAGHWAGGGSAAFEGVKSVIPEDEEIDLVVLSHSDADHLAAVDEILDQWKVKKVIRSGYKRTTGTWLTADGAIKASKEDNKTLDINLRYFEFPPGATYRFGDTYVTMVSGFHKPPSNWDINNKSEERNAGSIVIRLQFAGKAVLFTGDAVGRHIDDPPNALIANEKFMVENASVIPIRADVLLAPHHGADNGSSTAFIDAVDPTFVVFSAGHDHEHPRADAAQRYIDHGIPLDKMFRTDLGDDEGVKEWDFGRVDGRTDPPRDDDIDILIRPNGEVLVDYRHVE